VSIKLRPAAAMRTSASPALAWGARHRRGQDFRSAERCDLNRFHARRTHRVIGRVAAKGPRWAVSSSKRRSGAADGVGAARRVAGREEARDGDRRPGPIFIGSGSCLFVAQLAALAWRRLGRRARRSRHRRRASKRRASRLLRRRTFTERAHGRRPRRAGCARTGAHDRALPTRRRHRLPRGRHHDRHCGGPEGPCRE